MLKYYNATTMVQNFSKELMKTFNLLPPHFLELITFMPHLPSLEFMAAYMGFPGGLPSKHWPGLTPI